MEFSDIRWGGRERNNLARYRDQWRTLVNTVMNMQFPLNVRKFFSSWATGGFFKESAPWS
jgi:hypothetical protein